MPRDERDALAFVTTHNEWLEAVRQGEAKTFGQWLVAQRQNHPARVYRRRVLALLEEFDVDEPEALPKAIFAELERELTRLKAQGY